MNIPEAITCRDRFLRACTCQAVDRPPIWMMRQAGRSLPEYMKLKEGYKFTELVQTPERVPPRTLCCMTTAKISLWKLITVRS